MASLTDTLTTSAAESTTIAGPGPFLRTQPKDQSFRPDATHPLELHAAIYWSVFLGVILLTLGSLFMFYRCVSRHYSDVQYRLTYYDYETLGPSRWSLVQHLLLYRHRPLLLEAVKIFWLLTAAVCMALKFSTMSLTVMLVTWCLLDVCLLAAAIFYAVAESRVVRRRSQHAMALAKCVAAVYSLLFGVPIGSVTKLLAVFWLQKRVAVSLPFTLASSCTAATSLAMLLTALIMTIRACIRSSPVSETYRRNVYCLVICAAVGLLWAYLQSCLAQCSLLALGPLPSFMKDLGCTFWTQYWAAGLLPITLPMLAVSCALSAKMVTTGMIWRFFPEILLTWGITVAAHVSAFQLDVNTDAYYHYFVLQTVVVEFIIVVLLAVYNVYTILQTVAVWKAIRDRQMDRLVQLLHLTRTESNLYFGGGPDDRTHRHLNTLKKSVLQKLYEKMETYTTIRAFFHNTLRENIRKYGDVSQCAICFDDYTDNPSKVELGVSKVCGHYFHFECVWKWLEQRPTCPLCRDPVTLEKGDLQAITYELVQRATLEGTAEEVEVTGVEVVVEEQEEDVENSDATQDSASSSSSESTAESSTAEQGIAEPGATAEPGTTAEPDTSHQVVEVHADPSTDERYHNVGMLPRVQARRGQRSRIQQPPHHHQRSHSHPDASDRPPHTAHRRHNSNSSSLFAAFTTCMICRQRYAGNSSDIIVGFLPDCGHFFHYACVQIALEGDARCPQCVRKLESRRPQPTVNGSTTLSREHEHYNRAVTMDAVHFAFLMDVMCRPTGRRHHRPQ